MKELRLVTIDFFSNYYLVLLIALLLVLTVHFTNLHMDTRKTYTASRKFSTFSRREHHILIPSGAGELLSVLPATVFATNECNEVSLPGLSAEILIKQQRHTAYIIGLILEELGNVNESGSFLPENRLLRNADQQQDLLQWLQLRSLLAEEMLQKPMHLQTRIFWNFVYAESVAAQLVVIARNLVMLEEYEIYLHKVFRRSNEIQKSLKEDRERLFSAQKRLSLSFVKICEHLETSPHI